MQQSDEQLAAAAIDGDQNAFGSLVLRLRVPMIAFVTGVIGRRDDAEEIAQDAFLKAWQKLDTLRDPKRISAWIYRIARNRALQSVRKPQTVPLEWEPHERVAEPDERIVLLMTAVAGLDERHRDIISRKHFGGFSGEQIAKQLNIAPGTVRSRLSRAYAVLKKQIEAAH